jgi:hypothetical protein
MLDPFSRPGPTIGEDTWFSDERNARKSEGMQLAAHAFGEKMRTDRTKAEFAANKSAYEARKRAAKATGGSGASGVAGAVASTALGAAGTAIGGPIGGAIGDGFGKLVGGLFG